MEEHDVHIGGFDNSGSPKKSNWPFLIGAILLAIILVALYGFFRGSPAPIDNSWRQELKDYRDRAAAFESLVADLEKANGVLQSSNDSLKEVIINSQVRIVYIKQQGNEDRISISKLPPAEQYKLFTSWLPQIDTFTTGQRGSNIQ